jgi:hypothetical protein
VSGHICIFIMAAVLKSHQNDAQSKSKSRPEAKPDNIPDIIEERRKDSEGRIHISKYLRGKLLGKVSIINKLYIVIVSSQKPTVHLIA